MSNQVQTQPLASLCPYVTSSQPDHTIMVGDPRIADLFSAVMKEYGSNQPVAIDPLAKWGRSDRFCRDRGIVGLNHTYLIPRSLPMGYFFTNILDDEFVAHLPSHSSFIAADHKALGCGFREEYVTGALSYMQERHLRYRHLRSPIEGGNGYVFSGKDGVGRGIIGENSLALTMVGLEYQHDFDDEDNQVALDHLLETIVVPSDAALRKARNISHLNRVKSYNTNSNFLSKYRPHMTPKQLAEQPPCIKEEYEWTSNYIQHISAPLTEEDRLVYRGEGRLWEAKERLAKQIIADDLGLLSKNLAIAPQDVFHIDMMMFVSPDGDRVFLDESSDRCNPRIREEIERIGCRVVIVPGVHKVGEDSINFMNGIFVPTPEGPLFVTNGTGEDEVSRGLREQFVQSVENSFEENDLKFRIHFFKPTQEFLTRDHGGIHCLTREEPLLEGQIRKSIKRREACGCIWA